MRYIRGSKYHSSKKPALKVLILVICLVVGFSFLWWLLAANNTSPEQSTPGQATTDYQPQEVAELPDLQPVVDGWLQGNPGTYSIKITDTGGKVLAEHNSHEVFFAASIYKLYVAYIGYQKIDDGSYSLDEPYVAGYTRGQCLDAMIRDSHSPCAETMWLELGKEEITQKMVSYGLSGTSMTRVTTTASDAAIIMANIASGVDLSPESQASFMDSLKTQDAKFRRGLPSGFTGLAVYNKVGWNLDQEWHDIAAIELSSGQKLIVSAFSSGAGYSRIASLGAALESALQQGL